MTPWCHKKTSFKTSLTFVTILTIKSLCLWTESFSIVRHVAHFICLDDDLIPLNTISHKPYAFTRRVHEWVEGPLLVHTSVTTAAQSVCGSPSLLLVAEFFLHHWTFSTVSITASHLCFLSAQMENWTSAVPRQLSKLHLPIKMIKVYLFDHFVIALICFVCGPVTK